MLKWFLLCAWQKTQKQNKKHNNNNNKIVSKFSVHKITTLEKQTFLITRNSLKISIGNRMGPSKIKD